MSAQEQVRAKYAWQDGMGEISGMGGDYEAACREMLWSGLAWLDAHPDAKLEMSEFRGVFGLATAESEDAKALEEAVVAPVPDCSGAMHHAVMRACFFIKTKGWPAYVSAMTRRDA